MANLNQVNLIGHVTRDPELRYTPKGTATTLIGLAVNRTWKDSNGVESKQVTFIDVILWARLAEVAAEYLREGHPVFFTGRLQQEKWIDKQTGKNRTKVIVIAEGMQLLKQKPAQQLARQMPPPNTNNSEPQYPEQVPAAFNESFPNAKLLPTQPEEEIPF